MNKITGIGADICFEHHAPEKWAGLADMATEAGISFVRLGEFIWDILEKEENQIDLALLDQFVALLADRDLKIILCTPTASPPDWLCQKYPDLVPVKIDGTSFGTAVRRHTCPTSPSYRRHCERIVRAMAKHYGGHESVLAWQIDNELGDPYCYCPLCQRAFQEWLRQEFGSIEEFNFRVGQFFLGRTSRSFDEVPLPQEGCNPCLLQVYNRFMDHQIRECWGLQVQWLRDGGVTSPITTNAMLTWYGYDHEKFFAQLDVATGDCYPVPTASRHDLYHDSRFPGLAFHGAFLRGIKHGQNVGFMEMRWGPTPNDQQYPAPGEIKYWAYCCLAGGADFINFFRLDTCPSGLERGQFGLIPSSGTRPRAFQEVQELCAEVTRLMPALSRTEVPVGAVGILYSHPTHLALQPRAEIEELAGPFGNGYPMHLARHFRSLVSQNIPTDIVHLGDDFSKYRVLIVTALEVLDRHLARKLEAYVQDGGALVMTPGCARLDENAKQWEVPVPAHLTHVLGVTVENLAVLRDRKLSLNITPVDAANFPTVATSSAIDVLQPGPDTRVFATFQGAAAYDHLPALTEHSHGKGIAYYLAAWLDEQAMAKLYRAILKPHGVRAEFDVPEGIQFTKRKGDHRQGGTGDAEFYFFFNSANQPVSLRLPFPVQDVFSAQPVSDWTIQPLGYRIGKKQTVAGGAR